MSKCPKGFDAIPGLTSCPRGYSKSASSRCPKGYSGPPGITACPKGYAKSASSHCPQGYIGPANQKCPLGYTAAKSAG